MIDLSLALAPLTPADLPLTERLEERAFGPGRLARSAYRLREGTAPEFALSFAARVGTMLVGANQMTRVRCGAAPALLLGPLTVEPAFHKRGIGGALIRASLAASRDKGHNLVLLVGDEAFYGRFGFFRAPAGRLTLPGPVDPARILACELAEGALEGVGGGVTRA